MIQQLFREGLQRVRAQTFPHLTASLRVMEKLGMQPAGMGDEEGAVCYAVEHSGYA